MTAAAPTHRSRLSFALLYFSEGAPIGFVWWAIPAWLRSEGVALPAITGLTALLVLPWACKFLWAPLVDGWRSPRFGYRGWIAASQLAMGLTLLPLAWLHPATQMSALRACLLAHAMAAATQDVAIDALAIRSVPAAGRGMLNGWMQAGMLLGRGLFGGGALLLLGRIGPPRVIALLVACIWAAGLAAWTLREPVVPAGKVRAEMTGGLREALHGRGTWIGLAFALVSGATFEGAGALAGPLLIDRGLGATTVGWFFGLPALAATLLGGLAGGRAADRLPRGTTVTFGLCACTASTLALAAAATWAPPGTPALAWMGLLTALYAGIGMFIAASYALFMDLAGERASGTRFSAFMAATNGCESWSAWTAGQAASRFGYGVALAGLSLVSLASLPLLRWLRRPPPG